MRFAIAIPFFWFNPSIELSENGGLEPGTAQIKIPRLQRGIIDLLRFAGGDRLSATSRSQNVQLSFGGHRGHDNK
jgi:hypothetical protein